MAPRFQSFSRACASDSAIAETSCFTRKPNSEDTTTSGAPQTLVARTGVPHAKDSCRTFGHPSRELTRQLRLAALNQKCSSSLGELPGKKILSSSLDSRTSASNLERNS